MAYGTAQALHATPTPYPEPTATPAPAATAEPVLGIEGIICSFSWDCGFAVAVAWCESRLNPHATGAVGEVGIFQLRPEFHYWRAVALFGPGANLYDPYINIAAAHHLYLEQGWQPWTCARGGY